MSLVWVIYLIDVICQPWFGMWFIIFFFTLVFTGISICSQFTSDIPDTDKTEECFRLFLRKPVWKKLMILGISILFLSNFIPERDTAYKMLAAYGVEEAIKLPQVQGVADKSFQVLNKAMDDYLKESDKKEEKTKD